MINDDPSKDVAAALSEEEVAKPRRRIFRRPKVTRGVISARFNAADTQKLRWLVAHFDAPVTQILRDAVRTLYAVTRGEMTLSPAGGDEVPAAPTMGAFGVGTGGKLDGGGDL